MARANAPLLAACVASLLVCRAEAQPAPPLTPSEYRASLQTLLGAIRDPRGAVSPADVAAKLPTAWRVNTGRELLLIPSEPVRRQLSALGKAPDAGRRSRVESYLQRRLADLDAFEAPPRDSTDARRRLTAILARREFHAVRGPSWLDRLKQRIAEWVLAVAGTILGSSSFPTVASAVVFGLILLAMLVTAAWVYRALAGGPQPIVAGPVPVSAKEWTVWLREAREAAAAGHWQDAVRLAYWAGISSLESQGIWPPDRARTPREYLRLLPGASTHRPALSSLTGTFERVWYGNRGANAETFRETVAALQELGCQSN